MNKNWQNFMVASGAFIENGVIAHFGNLATEIEAMANNNCMADLSHYSVMEVSGDDATEFLQGQLTNDIKQIDAKHSQLSAYCTPKGRILSIFRLWKRDDSYLLTLPSESKEALISRLRMYVLRSKVIFKESELVHIGLAGPDIPALLRNRFEQLPQSADESMAQDDITITRIAGIGPRFEVIGKEAGITALWESLKPEVTQVGSHAWAWGDIVSGVPIITAESSEAFVPQMVNLELLNGVNFKKGCYPGQEIVARTKYLGKLKQRMFHGRVSADALPTPGTSLYAPEFNDQPAGKVMHAERAPDGKIDLLVVAQINSVRHGDMSLGSITGPGIEFVKLPYVIPELEEDTPS
ncbi:MAG: folate-binding protein YgfZ [Gammaproteobacteria bacterium]|nr:folate-binding protein YgfZ [Gammaproteobacteria bacterium]